MLSIRSILTCTLAAFALSDCAPPSSQYPYKSSVVKKRSSLKENLLTLLPAEQRGTLGAQQEAEWLADTAYKAAAAISRVNGSYFPGWFGNALINTRLQDRGLCWHYQHDMYRELRRRPLNFFRIGCCVRDCTERSEHNCVYIAAKNGEWPDVWMLDAWLYNGRLVVEDGHELNLKRWKDLPDVARVQSTYYPEGHKMPVEFWSVVRGIDGDYHACWEDEARRSSQYRRMYENVQRGKEEHPGTLINY